VIIEQAIADRDDLGIHGKEATAFLLGGIVELNVGASLAANIALANNTARLGTSIAQAYASLN
jgi:pseudouridine-5'-phosphate glycosidase